MFIYLITNTITGKYYVGQHKGNNLQKYLQQKISHALRGESKGSHLYNSMCKYPKDVWEIHPLVSDIQTKEELDKQERYFIGLLSSRNHSLGYNICRGGEGYTGPFTDEMKAAWCGGNKKYWDKHRQDLTGKTFNRLTVLSEIESRKDKRSWKSKRLWNCRCTCGNISVVATSALKSGNIKSCGCLYTETQKNRWDTMIGKVFGKLTVESEAEHYRSQRQWNCLCACGNRTVVRTNHLMAGDTQSCGGQNCKLSTPVSA